jgi:hypothetical protein
MKKLLLAVAVLAIAVVSQAQRGFGGGMMMGGGTAALLARDDVKEDLKLTDEQKEKLAALMPTGDREAMTAMFQEIMKEAGISDFQEMQTPEGQKKMAPVIAKRAAEMKKKQDAILTPEQTKRLAEINVQFNGNRVVTQPDVAKELGMTEDQNKAIAELNKKQAAAMRGLFQKVQSGEMTMEDVQATRKKNDEILDGEIGKLLTDKQKEQLKTMAGTKKFVRKDESG